MFMLLIPLINTGSILLVYNGPFLYHSSVNAMQWLRPVILNMMDMLYFEKLSLFFFLFNFPAFPAKLNLYFDMASEFCLNLILNNKIVFKYILLAMFKFMPGYMLFILVIVIIVLLFLSWLGDRCNMGNPQMAYQLIEVIACPLVVAMLGTCMPVDNNNPMGSASLEELGFASMEFHWLINDNFLPFVVFFNLEDFYIAFNYMLNGGFLFTTVVEGNMISFYWWPSIEAMSNVFGTFFFTLLLLDALQFGGAPVVPLP